MSSNVTLALVAGTLVGCGVYLLMARGVVRALLGVIMLGNGVNVVFLVASGAPGRAPIVGQGATEQADMSDPLPQALVLTAIVISLAMTAFVMAMGYRNSRLTAGDAIVDDLEDTRVRQRAGDETEEIDEFDTIDDPSPDWVDDNADGLADVEDEQRERAAGVPETEVR